MKVKFENLGTVNKNKVIFIDDRTGITRLSLWFSYETCVAYWFEGRIVCRQNDWSTTTGKLLNEIEPNKGNRIEGEQFEKQLGAILERIEYAANGI